MLKQYEELSVLEQGSDGAIVSIRGQDGPAVLLGAEYLGHLEHVLFRAEGEIGRASRESWARLLCAEVRSLLATYNETCNKYYGDQPPVKTLATVFDDLKQLRKEMGIEDE